jgi:hypothetical protein
MADVQTLRTQYRVSDFVEWQRNGALELNPNFQRRPVWKKGAKSYLIDTIIRGLPIPIIFLRDLRSDLKTLKAKRDVVDGQQRIRTILAFVDRDLLPDFDPSRDEFTIDAIHNSALGGKSFSGLTDELRQQILDYQFSVHSFAADTDDRQILQIFARMNSTGLKLNAQELRNAEFYGAFKTLAYELATEQLHRWREWRIFSPDQIARMNEVEFTSEFMMLIMDGVLEKNKETIDGYYDHFDKVFSDSSEVANRYRVTLDTIEHLLTNADISSLFKRRTVFFALFVAIYGMQYGLRRPVKSPKNHEVLKKTRPKPLSSGISNQLKKAAISIKDETAPSDVLRALRGATTHAGERRAIIGYLAGKQMIHVAISFRIISSQFAKR